MTTGTDNPVEISTRSVCASFLKPRGSSRFKSFLIVLLFDTIEWLKMSE